MTVNAISSPAANSVAQFLAAIAREQYLEAYPLEWHARDPG
ncbi:hypothetical protein [Acidovorax sp. sic0104]|nr:hypothetical protein [Acidovorax sp. sic0104]